MEIILEDLSDTRRRLYFPFSFLSFSLSDNPSDENLTHTSLISQLPVADTIVFRIPFSDSSLFGRRKESRGVTSCRTSRTHVSRATESTPSACSLYICICCLSRILSRVGNVRETQVRVVRSTDKQRGRRSACTRYRYGTFLRERGSSGRADRLHDFSVGLSAGLCPGIATATTRSHERSTMTITSSSPASSLISREKALADCRSDRCRNWRDFPADFFAQPRRTFLCAARNHQTDEPSAKRSHNERIKRI